MILPLPCRLMRDFRAVIRIDGVDMIHCGHHRTTSGIIAVEFIGYQLSRFTALGFEKTFEKAFGCKVIAFPLLQNINDVAALTNSTPQIQSFPLYGNKHFIDVPGIA